MPTDRQRSAASGVETLASFSLAAGGWQQRASR
jgi:hypothetical protein